MANFPKKEETRTESKPKAQDSQPIEYTIQLDRYSCIGTTACITADQKEWTMANDGKVNLHNSTEQQPEVFERTITQEDYERFLKSARACPVNAIRIFNKKTGERMV